MLRLEERIKKGENRRTEFKREVPPSLTNILKSIISFANDAGGDIFIGIDNDKNIIGLDTDFLELEEKFSNSVHDSISPIPSLFYRILNILDKQIFNIKVLSGTEKPYFIKKNGVENGTYIRIGSTNKQADFSLINEMRRQNLNQSYDEKIDYSYDCKNLSKSIIAKFTGKFNNLDKDPIEILARERFINKTNGNCYPTIGATILFSEFLPNHLEYASTVISKYRNKNRSNLISSIRINRGLLEAVPYITNEIKQHFWTNIEINSIIRKEFLEVPELSIREAIINSICHRDYSITGSSNKIDIFSDRLEILSPGNLPIGITLEDLGEGASEIRNMVIAKVYRRFGYIEKLGTGITRMISECKKNNLPSPVFEEIGRFFRVTFFKQKIKIDEFENKIYKEIKTRKEFRAKEISLKLDVHPNTILKYLKKMIAKGLIEKVGRGPNVRYRILM